MVKIETNIEDNIHRILLRPNQSSDWKTSLLFILIIAFTCLTIGIGFALAGATMILPFAGLEIIFVAICVYLVMKNTYKQEVITLTKDKLKIEKGEGKAQEREAEEGRQAPLWQGKGRGQASCCDEGADASPSWHCSRRP